MFASISYKRKTIYVVVFFLLLLLGAYKKNFKEVIALSTQLNLLDQNERVEDISTKTYYVQQEIDVIESLIGNVDISPEKVQQGVLQFITQSDYNINIKVFENTHKASDEKFTIYTHHIVLEGDYKNLILMLASLEKKFELSKIASVAFKVQDDYSRGKRKQLLLNILFQNYEKI